jgi:hypothetical protein
MADSTERISRRLLRVLGGESTVSAKDDVDDVLGILEVLSPRLVTLIIILLVLSLSCLREGWGIESVAEAGALEERVSRLRMHWALFVQDFLKLCALFLNFLPRGLRSTAVTSWSGLRFQWFPEWFRWLLLKWPLPLPCLSLLRLGKRSFSSSSWSAHHAIMSHSSTVVVGRLRPKSWYVRFEKSSFWKQRMTSSSVMLAMVARVSKKCWV